MRPAQRYLMNSQKERLILLDVSLKMACGAVM
jgi:hypothetical protein